MDAIRRPLPLLTGAQALSQLGDQISRIALVAVLWAGAAGAPAGELLKLVIIAGLPSIPIGLLAGTIADRHPTRRLLVICDLARAGIVALFPVLMMVAGSAMAIYAALPVLLGLNRAFRVARGRLLPEWVPSGGLARANAALVGVDRAAEVGGAAVAGVVVLAVGWQVAFVLDAVTYAMSAALLWMLPAAASSPAASSSTPSERATTSWRDVRGEARRRPDLVALALLPAAVTLIAGALTPIFLEGLPRHFGDRAPMLTGFLMSALAAGAVAAALLTRHREPSPSRMIGAALVLAPLAMILRPDLPAAMLVVLGVISGLLAAWLLIGAETVLQRGASRSILGRWLALKEAGERAAFLIGLVVTSALLVAGMPVGSIPLAGGVLLLGAGIAVLGALATRWRASGELGGRAMLVVLRLLRAIMRRAPLGPSLAVAGRIGRLTAPLHGSAAHAIRSNRTPLGVESRLPDVLDAYARAHVESAALAAGREAWFRDRVRLEGEAHLDRVLASDRGCVLVSAHIGNWDLSIQLLRHKLGPVALYTETLRPQALLDYYADLRSRGGGELISGRSGLRRAARLLGEGRVVGFLCDRSIDGRGVEVPWGDTVINLPAGPYRLAWEAGAHVLPGVAFRVGTGYLFRALEPLEAPDGASREEAVQALARQFAARLEGWVREVPDQWVQLSPLRPGSPAGEGGMVGTGSGWSIRTVVGR